MPMPPREPTPSAHSHRPVAVTLHGFSDFEGRALGSFLRLAGHRQYAYLQVAEMAQADFIVADAARAASLAAIEARGRTGDTVFIGPKAPAGAAARLPRPIDALQLLRELDVLVSRRREHALPDGVTPARAGANAAEGGAVDALIVDDSPVAQRFLQLRLSELGLGAQLAGHSAAAIEWLSRRSFGHVFIDLELGERSALDGLALCRHIRRAHHQPDGRVPLLVMVSAHHGELDRVRGTFAGCDHYLAKPVQAAQLRPLISPPRRPVG